MQSENSLKSQLQTTMNELDNRMKSIDSYLFGRIDSDQAFLTLRSQKGDGKFFLAKQLFYQELLGRIDLYGEADAYYIYSSELDISEAAVKDQDEQLRNSIKQYISDVNNLENSRNWHTCIINNELWLIHATSFDTFYYGAMLSLDNILQFLTHEIPYEHFDIYYGDQNMGVSDSKSSMITAASGKCDLLLTAVISQREIVQNLPMIERFRTSLSLFYLCLVPLLVFFIYMMLIKPIKQLENAMNELQTGNQDYQIESQSSSREFQNLFHAFNEMSRSIKHLRIRVYEKELDRKKMEIQNLQLQIHPHFLINLFKLMHGLVYAGQVSHVEKIILYLSDYFRYIFRSGRELERFENEYKLIKKYLEIANLRYPDTFEIEYKIADSIMDVEIPPLLIQNFIENAIQHGLRPNQKIFIRLEAVFEDGIVTFRIYDDGLGIKRETLEQINNPALSVQKENTHVGIKNSYDRIRYFYGPEARLYIDSEYGAYTHVVVCFPYDLNMTFEEEALS